MRTKITDKIFKMISNKKITILVTFFAILFFAIVLPAIINHRETFYLTAKFSESGPLYLNMPVFYKGYKIGEAKNIWPSNDYKYTFVKMTLRKEPKLSENMIAKVKSLSVKRNYIELLPPDELSKTFLKKGSIIEGEGAFDLEAFLSDIADSGLVLPLIENFSDAASSITQTSNEAGKLMSESRSTLKDNRRNLKLTTKNLESATGSLNELASRLNKSVNKNKIENSTSNINQSSNNILSATEKIKDITTNIDKATKNLDTTVSKVDSTINNANSITCDVKVITSGLRKTLSKKFAGMKIMFGKPVDNCPCPKNCPK